MQMRLRVSGSLDTSVALWEWLRAERELRGLVALDMFPPAPGTMGAVSELVVTLASSGTAAVLASSIRVWLTQRHSDIKITVSNEEGREITIDARRIQTAELEQLLLSSLSAPGPDPRPSPAASPGLLQEQ